MYNSITYPPSLSLAMSIAHAQQQQRQRAVSPSSAVVALKRRAEQQVDSDDDEVQITNISPPRILPGAPSLHGVKRERSDDEESSERRVAQRTSSEEEQPEMRLSVTKLVLILIKTNDEAILDKAVPNLLVALHEKNHEQRLKKQEDFYQVGGHLAVVTTMLKHPERKLLQQSGIVVLLHASYRNDVIRRAIGKVEGIQAILKAMKNFSEERDVQYQGFQALVNLMSEKPNAEILVNKLQGTPFILIKMGQHGEDDDILRWACELMKRLCRFNRLRPVIFEANAVETLANVLNTHKENEKIQKAAREAMKLLL